MQMYKLINMHSDNYWYLYLMFDTCTVVWNKNVVEEKVEPKKLFVTA